MKYLRNIKNVLKSLVSFSNYGNDIQLTDIDELKDLFIEFCDEFNYEFEESDNAILDKIVYTKNIFNDDKYGKHIKFSISFSGQRFIDNLNDIIDIIDDIYNRILSINYNCSITLYNIRHGDKLIIVFRIGGELSNVNRLNDLRKT